MEKYLYVQGFCQETHYTSLQPVLYEKEGEGERGEKRGKARGQGTARVSALTGALGRPARMRAGARGGRRTRGTEAWRDADVEAHRRVRWGGPRWPEAVGRGRLQCGSTL